jgi:thiol-disulfide isomerase/thioredoxin
MKKSVKIIICILAAGLVGGLIFTTVGLVERNQIIDKLEEENEELKDEIESLEEDVEELDYNLSLYKDTFGDEIEEEEQEESKPEEVEEYSNIKKISFKTLKKMINKEESFILLVSQTYCSHCIAFKPIFNEALSDNNLIGYELDIATISEKDYYELADMFPTLSGTPTTIFFKDGKEISEESRMVGYQEKEETVKAFKENGFIK